jgi:hypothetical protein
MRRRVLLTAAILTGAVAAFYVLAVAVMIAGSHP